MSVLPNNYMRNKVIPPSNAVLCNICTKKYHPLCTELKSIASHNQSIGDKKVWKCLDSNTNAISSRKNINKIVYADKTGTGTELDCVKYSLRIILSKIEELKTLI